MYIQIFSRQLFVINNYTCIDQVLVIIRTCFCHIVAVGGGSTYTADHVVPILRGILYSVLLFFSLEKYGKAKYMAATVLTKHRNYHWMMAC